MDPWDACDYLVRLHRPARLRRLALHWHHAFRLALLPAGVLDLLHGVRGTRVRVHV